MFDLDLFVIGGGSGGVRAARIAAETGARVALAEEFRMGGTCVIRGCVPKKLLVYASSYSSAFEDARGFGWSVGDSVFDWNALIAAKDRELERLEEIYRSNLGKVGVEVCDCRAEIVDPHTVRLATGDQYVAKHILVATGGSPFVPNVPGAGRAITSNEVFHLDRLPSRSLIVGGGYIACEFAGILNGCGSTVTQLYRGEQILRGFDGGIRQTVAEGMRNRGVRLCLETNVASIGKSGTGILVTDSNGEKHLADIVLYATGRHPNSGGMGLKEIGVEFGATGEIVVDAYSRTSVPSVYAIGDVTNRVNLTPVAIREGVAFVRTVFEGIPTKPDHLIIPTAVFTQPEAGTVGLTEEQAAFDGSGSTGFDVYESKFRPMSAALSGRDEFMLMKLVVAKPTETVMGCHIVGPGAAEMIQLAGIAVKMGATKDDFDRTVAVHPTAAEELVTMARPARSI